MKVILRLHRYLGPPKQALAARLDKRRLTQALSTCAEERAELERVIVKLRQQLSQAHQEQESCKDSNEESHQLRRCEVVGPLGYGKAARAAPGPDQLLKVAFQENSRSSSEHLPCPTHILRPSSRSVSSALS